MENEEVILYSTGCPKCTVLKKKLDNKGIEYTENNSVEEMLSLNITLVPALKVGGSLMDFARANTWINEQ